MTAIGSARFCFAFHCCLIGALHLLSECATIVMIMIRSQLRISSVMLYKS